MSVSKNMEKSKTFWIIAAIVCVILPFIYLGNIDRGTKVKRYGSKAFNESIARMNRKNAGSQKTVGFVIFWGMAGYCFYRWNKIEKEEQKEIERDKEHEKEWEEHEKQEANRERAQKAAETKRRNKLKIEEKKLEEDRKLIISILDTAGTGVVDEIENNDEFKKLLNKYEKEIAEIDRKHIKDFVKLSSYLKTKEKNIQLIFNSIKDTANAKDLNKYVGILNNEIHSYKLILFNSLNMIVALVENKPIIFYEIHESFDKLDVFNSNWENEISGKLSNIGDGLNDLMYSIHEMGADIVAEIGNLSYVTEDSSRMLAEKLEEVDSSVKTNNLLAGIQTYQLYKLNKSNRNRLE